MLIIKLMSAQHHEDIAVPPGQFIPDSVAAAPDESVVATTPRLMITSYRLVAVCCNYHAVIGVFGDHVIRPAYRLLGWGELQADYHEFQVTECEEGVVVIVACI
jgi:hypothetical protein